MIATLQQILHRALERLAYPILTVLPALIAGLLIFLAAFLLASLVRWALTRIIKAAAFDRFLAQSGVSSLLGRSGRLRAAGLVAGAAYWIILLAGALTAVSAFDNALSSSIIQAVVLLFPKLVTAGMILLAGAWLAQYLGRSVLVWTCNEGIPYPRRIASGVRILILFVSVVVAADHLDFARNVFLAAFILLVGGAVLALSIAAGLAVHAALLGRLGHSAGQDSETSLWNHL